MAVRRISKQGESSFGEKIVAEIEWKFSKSKPKLLDCVDENQRSLALRAENMDLCACDCTSVIHEMLLTFWILIDCEHFLCSLFQNSLIFAGRSVEMNDLLHRFQPVPLLFVHSIP